MIGLVVISISECCFYKLDENGESKLLRRLAVQIPQRNSQMGSTLIHNARMRSIRINNYLQEIADYTNRYFSTGMQKILIGHTAEFIPECISSDINFLNTKLVLLSEGGEKGLQVLLDKL